MKNKLNKIVLSTLLVASTLVAGESTSTYTFDDTYSFVGIEGGVGRLDVERSDGTNPSTLKKYDMFSGGLKIGAQTENYKVYLNANYYDADDFDYLATYGVGIQYMFNLSKRLDAFLGVNGGIANMKFLPAGEANTRTISDPYFGGEAGVNIHMGQKVDLELGARFYSMDASNSIADVKYTFDNMISAYASVNFKFKMN